MLIKESWRWYALLSFILTSIIYYRQTFYAHINYKSFYTLVILFFLLMIFTGGVKRITYIIINYINQISIKFTSGISNKIKCAFFFIFLPIIFYILRTSDHGDTAYAIFDTNTPIGIADAGAMAIHYILYKCIFEPLNLSGSFVGHFDPLNLVGATTYIVMATIFGGIAMFLIWQISKIIFSNFTIFYFFLIILSGSTGLFFGYIENYAILVVSILLYIISGVYFFFKNKSLFFPTITASIAAMMHLIGFVVFPSLVFLFYCDYKNKRYKLISFLNIYKKYFLTYIFLVFVAYFIMWQFKEPTSPTDDITMWIPMLNKEKQMTEGFLSYNYYKTKINELLILSGTTIFAVLLLIFKKLLAGMLCKFEIFLGLVSFGCLMPLILINTLGSANWGVTSTVGYPLLFLCLRLIDSEKLNRIQWLLTMIIFNLLYVMNFFWFLWFTW